MTENVGFSFSSAGSSGLVGGLEGPALALPADVPHEHNISGLQLLAFRFWYLSLFSDVALDSTWPHADRDPSDSSLSPSNSSEFSFLLPGAYSDPSESSSSTSDSSEVSSSWRGLDGWAREFPVDCPHESDVSGGWPFALGIWGIFFLFWDVTLDSAYNDPSNSSLSSDSSEVSSPWGGLDGWAWGLPGDFPYE